MHELPLETPSYRAKTTERKDFPKFLASTEDGAMRGFDAHNWIRRAEAMMGHDVSRPFGGKLIVTCS